MVLHNSKQQAPVMPLYRVALEAYTLQKLESKQKRI